jgi:hypothetical protein
LAQVATAAVVTYPLAHQHRVVAIVYLQLLQHMAAAMDLATLLTVSVVVTAQWDQAAAAEIHTELVESQPLDKDLQAVLR